jgi:hypothetical protein
MFPTAFLLFVVQQEELCWFEKMGTGQLLLFGAALHFMV